MTMLNSSSERFEAIFAPLREAFQDIICSAWRSALRLLVMNEAFLRAPQLSCRRRSRGRAAQQKRAARKARGVRQHKLRMRG